MGRIGMDAAYAVRRMLKAPGFTAVAVVSLALGIGANTAMFSIVNAVLLADPPFERPSELVELYTSDASGTPYGPWSYPDFTDLREGSGEVFAGVSASRTMIASGGLADRSAILLGEAVTPNHFELHGVPMVLGPGFGPQYDGPSGTSPVVVISHGLWLQEFGGDRDVIGQSYRINQLDYTVVGVTPEWYTGSFPAFHSSAFTPMNMSAVLMAFQSDADPLEQRGSRSMFVRGRLADGVSVEQANGWLGGFSTAMGEAHPATNRDRVYQAIRLDEILVHPIVDRALLPVAGLLMAMVGLVLLIACVNLAGFLLARAEARRREIGVRLALGAGRAALVRQLLVETTMIALLGGLAGIGVAHLAVDALVSVRPPIPVPLNLDFPLDGRVLGFTLGASVLAGVLFGLVPALQATNPGIANTLRDEAGSVTRRGRMRSALVVAQVAFSVVLLVGSGLFLRSLLNAQGADPGFYEGEAAIIWPQLALTGLGEAEGQEYWGELERRLLADPDITQVGFTDFMPLGFGVQTRAFQIDGFSGDRADGGIEIDIGSVSAGFFATLEVPIVVGRGFDAADPEGERQVVVSRALASRYFPNGAVGETLDAGGSEPWRIIGVAEDTKVRTIGEDPRPKVYMWAEQQYLEGLQVVVRGRTSGPELLARSIAIATELEPRLVLFDRRTMSEHLAVHLFPPRMAALLLSIFGGLALLLAAIGIWGVVSHSAAKRTREVGIRMTLGATRPGIVRMLVGDGLRLVVVGLAGGLVLAAATGVLVSGFLYDVGLFDPVAYLGIPLVLLIVSVGASWVPASRASRADPLIALRSD